MPLAPTKSRNAWLGRTSAAMIIGVGTQLVLAGPAGADELTYLVNVTVRPGYHFANAADALSYGHAICAKLAEGQGYPELMSTVANDVATTDQYQASYLISQAVNELCPTQIWYLRTTAANYRVTQ